MLGIPPPILMDAADDLRQQVLEHSFYILFSSLRNCPSQDWQWPNPVILATWKAEIRRISVQPSQT
jgi:hypothetical protein